MKIPVSVDYLQSFSSLLHLLFRLQVCVIVIMGSEVSEKVLSWLRVSLIFSFLFRGSSWWGGEARELIRPPLLSIQLLLS